MQLSSSLFLILGLFGLSCISYIYADTDPIIIKEWDIPTPDSAPHDIVVGPNDLIWFTEINTNKIGMFNPNTEEFQEYDIPTPSSRPHGLVTDIQGNVWFTEVGAGKIGKLDPASGVIEEFSTPTTNSGPHTPIFADNTTLWFTEQSASQIGKLDVTTGKIIEFSTITKSANPYGIITDEKGNAWFAELRGHHVGKVDAETGEVTEYPMISDNSGPRRIAIDSNGILWITLYNSGKIASLNPITNEVKEYPTSSESSGPYAIWVDPFDHVWFSMTGIYKMGKFDQTTQKIQEYEMPSPQTHIKFIHSDSIGNIWFPNYNNNKIGVILTGTTPTEPKTDSKMMEDNQKNKMDITSNKEFAYFPAPLKQIQDGVKPQSVTCTEGLELVLKFSNGKPACLKPDSVSKLIERGWAIHVLPDYEKNNNNNSVTFSIGEYQVETTDLQYFMDAKGYLAKPSIDGEFPAIVMIHEFWGLNDNIKQMAEKMASHGYVVLAVDLYDGKVGTTSDEARQLRSSFEQSHWTDNMNVAVNYLEEQYAPPSIGSIGWCFGGGQSLNLALNNDALDATVIYYGSLTLDKDQLSSVDWPILGIFAGLDSGIPPETVNQFETVLNELEIENEIYIYPEVNHAFANPSGDRHAPEESKDAWEKTLKFFDQNLR